MGSGGLHGGEHAELVQVFVGGGGVFMPQKGLQGWQCDALGGPAGGAIVPVTVQGPVGHPGAFAGGPLGLSEYAVPAGRLLIPLLEYVDSLGMTRLRGGQRRLLPTSPVCQQIADAVGGLDTGG